MEEQKKYDVAGVIGRFQIDVPHPAHMSLIHQALDNHQNIVVFLGVSKLIGTKRNPMNFQTRKLMLEQYFEKEAQRIVIIPIPDQADDDLWSKEVDARLDEIHPNRSIVLYGGRDSFKKSYSGKHDTIEIEQELYVSATDARLAASLKVLQSTEYRIGLINAAYAVYDKSISAVDAAVFDTKETKLLMAKKPGEKGWRFIGGHEDPGDDTGEQAINRELMEETGGNANFEISDYLGRVKVDDWRYRGEADAMKTTFYKAHYTFGPLQPKDDISELKWVKVEEFKDLEVVPEHVRLKNIVMDLILDGELIVND